MSILLLGFRETNIQARVNLTSSQTKLECSQFVKSEGQTHVSQVGDKLESEVRDSRFKHVYLTMVRLGS